MDTKTLKRGDACFALLKPDKLELTPAIFCTHHPEADAVGVRISGEDWTVRTDEILTPPLTDLDLPPWLRSFVDTMRAAPLNRQGNPNKAHVERELRTVSYHKISKLERQCQQLGISLTKPATPTPA